MQAFVFYLLLSQAAALKFNEDDAKGDVAAVTYYDDLGCNSVERIYTVEKHGLNAGETAESGKCYRVENHNVKANDKVDAAHRAPEVAGDGTAQIKFILTCTAGVTKGDVLMVSYEADEACVDDGAVGVGNVLSLFDESTGAGAQRTADTWFNPVSGVYMCTTDVHGNGGGQWGINRAHNTAEVDAGGQRAINAENDNHLCGRKGAGGATKSIDCGAARRYRNRRFNFKPPKC